MLNISFDLNTGKNVNYLFLTTPLHKMIDMLKNSRDVNRSSAGQFVNIGKAIARYNELACLCLITEVNH